MYQTEKMQKLCLICQFKRNLFDWCSKCRLKHFELNYGNSPSGNIKIDNLLKDSYCKSTRLEEIIEWIPYNKLKNITRIVNKNSSELYSTISWLNNYICNWNKDKLTWSRKNKDTKVTLIYFEKSNDLYKNKRSYDQIYGITKDLKSFNYILICKFIDNNIDYLCIKCQFEVNFFYWCESCKLNHFKLNYGESSGNSEIDKILKNNYCKSKLPEELIEWIPYNEFKNITHMVKKNLKSYSICYWDKYKLIWGHEIKRLKVTLVYLKKSDKLIHYIIKVLNAKEKFHQFYGISKDQKSLNYIFVFNFKGNADYLCIRCRTRVNFFYWCKNCKLEHFKSNYENSPSGNDEIDMILKDNYYKSKLPEELIEWIPYKDITNIVNKKYSKLYSASWSNGHIDCWDKNRLNWSRKDKSLEVTLIYFENLDGFNNYLYEVLNTKTEFQEFFRFYGISRDPISLNYILVCKFKLCFNCRIIVDFFLWCKNCKLNHFRLNYGESPSGNDYINNILEDNYCESESSEELIEWIPYKDIMNIVKKSSKLYIASWSNGHIDCWDKNRLNWSRKDKSLEVTLIYFENLDGFNNYLKILNTKTEFQEFFRFYGISRDPISLNYILVCKFKLCFNCRIVVDFFLWCKNCKLNHFRLNYGESPSGNDYINNILEDNYCESKSSEELIEWIPHNKFKDITHVVNEKSLRFYSALWLSGNICYWDKNILNWNRGNKELKVTLIYFENLNGFNNYLYEILNAKKEFQVFFRFYGVSRDSISPNYILVCNVFKLCLKCRTIVDFFCWCKSCKLNHFQLNYGKCPSGNDNINNMLEDNYCESKLSEELIEWIPYYKFKNITHIVSEESLKLYSSSWLSGNICRWNKNKLTWNRGNKDMEVTLIYFGNLGDFNNYLCEVLDAKKEFVRFYGMSRDPVTFNYILICKSIDNLDYLCINCRPRIDFFRWCKNCKLNHFQLNYGEFLSGNNEIDKILKDRYCESKLLKEFVEWIPYNEFENITQIINEESLKFYSASWLKRDICDWDKDRLNWSRKNKFLKVTLIYFENLDGLFDRIHRCHRFYGISKDPASLNYILICSNFDYLCIKCRSKVEFFYWCKNCKLKHFKLNYGEFPSGNDKIDNLLKDNYCESKLFGELIEWIPYNELNIFSIESDTLYKANRVKGYIIDWNFDENNWKRAKNQKVTLKIFKSLSKFETELYYMLTNYHKNFGISKDPITNYYICVLDNNLRKFLCFNCLKSSSFFDWCDKCKILHFNFNYSNFPSGNDELDLILKSNYCESNKVNEFIEWIPYTSFIDIKFINQGGFSKVYGALWLKNNIYEWDNVKLEWKRFNGYKNVALKVLNNSYNISEFLQEVQTYYHIGFSHKFTKLYGVSKDPKTQNYILVLEYVNYGSLRSFLDKYNKYLLLTFKIRILKNIAEGLKEIHSKNLIHRDIHSGNILNIDFDRIKITDLGLSKYIDNNEGKKVYGSLPYLAPEVLQGKSYTEKADIYAFGIIINEVFTGERPFINSIYNDEINLTIDICRNGLRPKIHENAPKLLINLLSECWDANPENRPTADEIIQELSHFENDEEIFKDLRNYNNKILMQYIRSTDRLSSYYSKKSHSSKLLQPVQFTKSINTTSKNMDCQINSSNLFAENQVAELAEHSQCLDCAI